MRPYMEKTNQQIFLSHHTKSYDFPAHFHQNIELAYCFSGSQTIKVGEEAVTLKQGDACMVFPNTVHEYCAVPGVQDSEVLSVICNVSLLTNIFPDILSKRPINPHLPSAALPDGTANTFRQLLTAETDMELIGFTYLILSNLLKHLDLTTSPTDLELPAVITAYIDANFQEPLTIEVLAKKFGYHPSYIAHLFCDRLKIPFRTYLSAVRCDYAAAQIRTTHRSLTEIAYESGFGSLNTFCRAFKKNFSKTPSQYKKSVQ